MTDNIQKLYKLAGVKPYFRYHLIDKSTRMHREKLLDKTSLTEFVKSGRYYLLLKVVKKYTSPFTAEKQLELIKWLAHKAHNGLLINKHITDGGASMVFDNLGYESTPAGSFISFEECLANLINNVWINLTEEERTQIKEILG